MTLIHISRHIQLAKERGFFCFKGSYRFETPNQQLHIVKLRFSQGQPFGTGQPLAHSPLGEVPLPFLAFHMGRIIKPEKVIFRNINEYVQ